MDILRRLINCHVIIISGRVSAKRETVGIKFTQRPKISSFAPQGRLVAPIHVKFGRAEGQVGPLGLVKFHTNRCTGVGTRPQNRKYPLFGKNSPHRVEPFDRFLQTLGAFMRPIILH